MFYFWAFFQQPSRSVKYLRFHCSCSNRERDPRRAKKKGEGEKHEDETGIWEKKQWQLCHLHLNRISYRHGQLTTNLRHSHPQWEEPALMFLQSDECGLFASCCSISVAARRTPNFPSSWWGVAALTSSCLPENATVCWCFYAARWVESALQETNMCSAACLLVLNCNLKKPRNISKAVFILWHFRSDSAGSDRK